MQHFIFWFHIISLRGVQLTNWHHWFKWWLVANDEPAQWRIHTRHLVWMSELYNFRKSRCFKRQISIYMNIRIILTENEMYSPRCYWWLIAWFSLHWRHNGHDSVSNRQAHDCLLYRLFRRWSKKTSKLRATGLCARNSPGTGEFPAQMASNAENVSIWWRHHVLPSCRKSDYLNHCSWRSQRWLSARLQ